MGSCVSLRPEGLSMKNITYGWRELYRQAFLRAKELGYVDDIEMIG